jgi:transcription elongation factor Elf1
LNEAMRPLRSSSSLRVADEFETRARAWCRSCGKMRELGPDELYAADMAAFKELERRFRCSDCGERAVSIEAIFHPDWK